MRRPILDRMAGEGCVEGMFRVRFEALYEERTCMKVLRWVEEELAYN